MAIAGERFWISPCTGSVLVRVISEATLLSHPLGMENEHSFCWQCCTASAAEDC